MRGWIEFVAKRIWPDGFRRVLPPYRHVKLEPSSAWFAPSIIALHGHCELILCLGRKSYHRHAIFLPWQSPNDNDERPRNPEHSSIVSCCQCKSPTQLCPNCARCESVPLQPILTVVKRDSTMICSYSHRGLGLLAGEDAMAILEPITEFDPEGHAFAQAIECCLNTKLTIFKRFPDGKPRVARVYQCRLQRDLIGKELRMGTVARNSILQLPESGSIRGVVYRGVTVPPNKRLQWTHLRSVDLWSNAKACRAEVLTFWRTLFVTTSWLLSHIADIRRIVQDDVHSDALAITGTSVCIAMALQTAVGKHRGWFLEFEKSDALHDTSGGQWWSSWSGGNDGAPPGV